MPMLRLNDLRNIRHVLGMSQHDLSTLLGISIRAVQSYEQGWRAVPPYVQKLTGLLLYLERRKGMPRLKPCWKVKKCPSENRRACPVHKYQAGEICWIVSGDLCGGKEEKSWEDKMICCAGCPMMGSWLSV